MNLNGGLNSAGFFFSILIFVVAKSQRKLKITFNFPWLLGTIFDYEKISDNEIIKFLM